MCDPILEVLDQFQSRVPVAVAAFEKLEELQMYFATHEQSDDTFGHHFGTRPRMFLSRETCCSYNYQASCRQLSRKTIKVHECERWTAWY